MEPLEACRQAMGLIEQGDLVGAAQLIEPVLKTYRDYGPAYLVHARIFLIAGDCAQPMVDLDAAEWANREYGTPEQQQEVIELRAVAHAIRTIYAGKNEAKGCREAIAELIRKRAKPQSWWFLPAACYEFDFKQNDAKAWVDEMSQFADLQQISRLYFTKPARLTQLLKTPKDPDKMAPIHYARYLRAKREGDRKGAEKHASRLVEAAEPGSYWSIIGLYATHLVHVTAA